MPLKRKGGTKDRLKPPFKTTSKAAAAAAEVVEFEVEIVKVLKVVVPKGVTDERVKTASVNREVRFEISAADEAWTLTDGGMAGRVHQVRPWD